MLTKKQKEQYLSNIILQSLALSILLTEKFEIMQTNKLLVQKPKFLLNRMVPALEEYVTKMIKVEKPEEKEDILKGATIVQELYMRMEDALNTTNIMDISNRKTLLLLILEEQPIPEEVRKEIYDNILERGLLNY